MKINSFLKKVTQKNNTAYYFSGEKMEIYIPKEFVDRSFASPIGAAIKTIGLFLFKVFPTEESKEGKLYELQIPVPIIFTYSDESKKTLKLKNGFPTNEYFVYTLYHNDIFMKSDVYVQNKNDILNFISRMLHNGKIPNTTIYEDALKIYLNAMYMNNVSLGSPAVIFEAILSEMFRDKKNTSKPFRLTYDGTKTKELDYKCVKMVKIPELVSSFSGITSEDVRHQIVAGILRTKENKKDVMSPVEMVVKL